MHEGIDRINRIYRIRTKAIIVCFSRILLIL